MRISELSRRVGVSPETLRAWERRYGVLRPRRTAGNTRLYSALDEARVRMMQRYIADDLSVAEAAEMAMSAQLRLKPGQRGAIPPAEAERAIGELRGALDVYDETSADRVVQQLLGAYATTAILRDVMLPYLREVGERWERAHLTIAQEHFASHFLQSRLQMVGRGWDRGLGPRAIIAAAPGDHHTLGLMCFGIALHRLGWRIVALGAATPVEMLADVVATTRARAVVISASMTGMLEAHVAALSDLAARTRLGLGGRAASLSLARQCSALLLRNPIDGAEEIAIADAQTDSADGDA
jgi:DNA-binding transcriptional MerR regulator